MADDERDHLTMLYDLRADADHWGLTPAERIRWVGRLEEYHDRRFRRLIEHSYEVERRGVLIVSALAAVAWVVVLAVVMLRG